MARTISASVGFGGVNRPGDISTIQIMLNQVPPLSGRPGPLLAEDAICGTKTVTAIQQFQKHHFGFSSMDGRVDPGKRTLQKLNEFDSALPLTPPVPGQLNTLRDAIVRTAKGESDDIRGCPPYGRVSDRETIVENGETVRKGWCRLKEYFDKAMIWPVSPQNWPRGYLEGVKKPGHWLSREGTKSTTNQKKAIHWCGIFATWVLNQASPGRLGHVRWFYGRINQPPTPGPINPGPGDILILKGDGSHHCIVTALISENEMETVNGNSDYQSILVKPVRKQDIAAYYSVAKLAV